MKFISLFLTSSILLIFSSVLVPFLSAPVKAEDTEKKESRQTQVEPVSERKSEPENDASEREIETDADPKNGEEGKNSEEEEAETEVKKPTPEETARLKKLAIADQLYLGGDKATAVKLYREAKEKWQIERIEDKIAAREVFNDSAQLSPAGKVFWRNYQQGKKQQFQSKVLSALKLLTTREPEFLPGHIAYAEALLKYERPAQSETVLNRAVNLYPNEPIILRAKMDAYIAAENWLDASIMARQYALFNPDSPQAEEFERLANKYLAEYQRELKSNITWNAVGNAIAGTVGFVLTGNIFGPLSALETTALLLQGESAVGEASVSQIKKQVPLLQDEAVTEYVNRIGQKIAAASGREEFDYRFHVVMDDTLNAFALPGGKIFVNAGAIMKTDSEAELAGLLAHEVSHSALSHGFQLVTKGNLTANIVSYIPYVGNTASSLIVLNYSRDMEKQADVFGTRILVNAGYAADGVRNLMAQLDESRDEDNPEPPAWLSSHPNSKQRISYIEQLVVERNLNRYAYEGVYSHKQIKQIVSDRWKQYEKCIEEVDTIEEAKACAGEKEPSKKAEEYMESEAAEGTGDRFKSEVETPEVEEEQDTDRD